MNCVTELAHSPISSTDGSSMSTYYTRKEYRVQIARDRRAEFSSSLASCHYLLFPGALALLFVMFKRGIQTANRLRSRFEQCLRLGIIDLSDVTAQMIDECSKFSSHICRMRSRIF